MAREDWPQDYQQAVANVYTTYTEYVRQTRGDTSRGRVLPSKVALAETAWIQALAERGRLAAELYPDEDPREVLQRYLRDYEPQKGRKRG